MHLVAFRTRLMRACQQIDDFVLGTIGFARCRKQYFLERVAACIKELGRRASPYLSRATWKRTLRATLDSLPTNPSTRTPPPFPRARSRVQNECKCDFRKSQGQKRKEAVSSTPETAVRKP